MEYLNQRRNLPFEVQAFTSPQILCEYAKTQPIEILLISDKAMCEEVRRLKVGKLIILTEGVHNPELDQYPSVYKYQASDSVVREVMECYGAEKAARESLPQWKRQASVIGIYSPVGRCQKTSFALTLGQILAKDRAVLYLNLESYSGFEQLLGEVWERNLSDLLYFLRQDNASIVHKLSGMIQSVQNLDFVPPALAPMDIQCTDVKEWLRLIDSIVSESAYEVLILDLGDCVQELYQILDVCTKVYVPVRGDSVSMAKLAQFENLLRMWDYESVLEKLQKIKPPFYSTNRTGKGYIEELAWSEMGDYVRQLQRRGPE
ncbi:MAG TPA: hypothetical protein IAB52_02475 [Candidatus Scatomonas merdavium]|nr:hypothetical protein [Candidatus Scatomonas merdavium]